MKMFPFRYVVLVVVVLSTTITYITRSNINIAIVSMVKQPSTITSNVTSNSASSAPKYDYCPVPSSALNKTTKVTDDPETAAPRYEWNQQTQGMILGAFFYVYVLIQVPSARMSERFGSKWIMAIGIFGSGLINLLTPTLASSVVLLTMSRIVLGLIQGGIYPAGFQLLCRWFPLNERSTALGLLSMGSAAGNTVSSILTGYLSEHGFAGGWPSAFYVAGLMALVVTAIFVPLITSAPEDNRFVSQEELDIINKDRPKVSENAPKLPVPWLEILTSKRYLAFVYAKFTLAFANLLFQTKLPTYMSDILHIPPTENGLLISLLYVAFCITLSTAGGLSEKIIQSKWVSRTNTRKLFVAIGYVGTALCLVAAPLVGCAHRALTGVLVVAHLLMGLSSGGDIPMPAEMSTNFVATAYSVGNMVSMSSGFVAPTFVGTILSSGDDAMNLWKIIFFMTAAFAVSGSIVFGLFAQASVQPWDTPKGPSSNNEGTIDYEMYQTQTNQDYARASFCEYL